MTYKMFIDDERQPPGQASDWVIARSSDQAIEIVLERGVPEFVSYDHDLGENDISLWFIYWLIDRYLEGDITTFPVNYTVHSQNPVGAKNIQGLLDNFIEKVINSKE